MTRSTLTTTLLSLGLAGCALSEPGSDGGDPQDRLVWQTRQATGTTTPVLSGGTLYLLRQSTHAVTAVAEASGDVKWSRVLPVSHPTGNGDGLVMAGGHVIAGDLEVFALDPATGDIEWKFSPSVGLFPGFGSLAAAGDVIYAGSTTGHLYSIDAVTGAERWVGTLGHEDTQVWNPVVDGNRIFVGFTEYGPDQRGRGGAAAFDAATGSLVWKRYAPVPDPSAWTDNAAGVVVTPTLVVMGSTTAVYGLDRTTGAIVKTVAATEFGANVGPTYKALAYNGSRVFAGSGFTGRIIALDPQTLDVLWRQDGFGGVHAMAADASRIYVSRTGVLSVHSTQDGSMEWQMDGSEFSAPGDLFLAAPLLGLERFYLAGTSATYAFRIP